MSFCGATSEKLLLIVGTSGTREITYVDCFAGPSGARMVNRSMALPSPFPWVSSKASAIRWRRRRHRLAGLRLRAVFVEKAKRRYQRLADYLAASAPLGIECHGLCGDYFELQDEILNLCGNGFAFFFIDPKGWKDVTIPKLRKLAARPRSELLVNFMYDFFNRFIDLPSLSQQVTDMLGMLDESDRQRTCNLLAQASGKSG